MGVGAGLYMCDVVKKFTFAISSPDEFLFGFVGVRIARMPSLFQMGSAPNFGVAGAEFSKISGQALGPHPVAVKSCNLDPRCLVQTT